MDILSDEPFFKFPAEFQIFFIDRGELIFTDNRCEALASPTFA